MILNMENGNNICDECHYMQHTVDLLLICRSCIKVLLFISLIISPILDIAQNFTAGILRNLMQVNCFLIKKVSLNKEQCISRYAYSHLEFTFKTEVHYVMLTRDLTYLVHQISFDFMHHKNRIISLLFISIFYIFYCAVAVN